MRYASLSAVVLTVALLTGPAAAESTTPSPGQIAQSDAGTDTRKAQLDFWNSIKGSKKAEDYQAYLDKYPDGDFADLAKLRVKKYAPPPPTPAAAPPEPAKPDAVDPQKVEIEYWNSVKTSKSAEDYQAYLNKYPNGDFADLAKLRIQQYSAPTEKPMEKPAEAAPATAPASAVTAPAATAQPAAPAPAAPTVTFDDVSTTVYAKSGGQVRAAPDSHAALLTKLKTNTEVHATGVSSDRKWWRVQTVDGGTGYMHSSVVSEQRVAVAAPSSKKAAPEQAAAAAPTGPDEDVCKPDSAAGPNDRVAACERLLAKAGSDDAAKFAGLNNLGAALNQAQRNDEAVRKYEQAAALKPRDATVYTRIGLVRLDQFRFPEARTAFEKAAQLDSTNPDIVFQRGIATIGFGDFEKAKLEVKRALLSKDDAAYYEKLGEIEIARGDLASAKTALERGAKADPNRRSLILLAVNYFAGTPEQAAAQAAGVVDDPRAALWSALIKKAKGDAGGATQVLDTARPTVGEGEWPGPVFDYMSGKLDAGKARAAARSKTANTQFQQLCALNFFIGEWAYLAGDKDAARAALQAALDTRAYYMLEYAAAKARLANMGG